MEREKKEKKRGQKFKSRGVGLKQSTNEVKMKVMMKSKNRN